MCIPIVTDAMPMTAETRTALRQAAQHVATACSVRIGDVDIVFTVDEDAEAEGREAVEWCVKIPVKTFPRRKADTRWTTVRGVGISPMAAAIEAVARFHDHMRS